MEEAGWAILFLLLILFFFFLSTLKRNNNNSNKHKNLPPSPTSLPLIGHLHHLIKEPLHLSLHNLVQNYGQILLLKLGTRNVLVVSSPSAVEECFTKNDITFANRPRTLAAKHLNYNQTTVGFARYGDHWRNLRRLTTMELFSTNRLAMFARLREEEVQLLVKQIFDECCMGKKEGAKVEIELKTKLIDFSFNVMLRMISGKRYYGKHGVAEGGKEFQILMREFTELEGNGNLNDFFPVLRWVDFQGLEKRMIELMKKMDRFLQNLLDEHRTNRTSINQKMNMTLIDVMLHLRETEPEFYTDDNMKGVMLIMLVAGSETSAITMEWALSLLLNHPEAMVKVRNEIDTKVGKDQLVKESDLVNLKNLQNVITETLRLYPVTPQLLPHESSCDCIVGGFHIPKGTMLLVNLWTLHRNGELWKDPTRFMPERFEVEGGGGEVCYNMIPFGIGRRACPGAVFAKRIMGHTLGALIQCFEFERVGSEEINMKEGLGLTMPRVEPLMALCRTRQNMIKVLSKLCVSE
ncbi:hypothetical protein PIB30_005383 [Stylosanthes scabra]|uniref:Cytochrome P450 n=1 Tax=Stylosanthes scabra TaxID=79078 RepID=A0ABU6W224_9FABA|nr:hypothetical protein [Stylosanthes scabra]